MPGKINLIIINLTHYFSFQSAAKRVVGERGSESACVRSLKKVAATWVPTSNSPTAPPKTAPSKLNGASGPPSLHALNRKIYQFLSGFGLSTVLEHNRALCSYREQNREKSIRR